MKRILAYLCLVAVLCSGCAGQELLAEKGSTSPSGKESAASPQTSGLPWSQDGASESAPSKEFPKDVPPTSGQTNPAVENEPEEPARVDTIFGDFDVVAHFPSIVVLESYDRDRSSAYVGTALTLSEKTCKIDDVIVSVDACRSEICLAPDAQTLRFLWLDIGNLATVLDLSDPFRKRWDAFSFTGMTEVHYSFNDSPEISWIDRVECPEYMICRIVVLDENHLFLGPGYYNLLAVRGSHLEAGCNFEACLQSEFFQESLTAGD